MSSEQTTEQQKYDIYTTIEVSRATCKGEFWSISCLVDLADFKWILFFLFCSIYHRVHTICAHHACVHVDESIFSTQWRRVGTRIIYMILLYLVLPYWYRFFDKKNVATLDVISCPGWHDMLNYCSKLTQDIHFPQIWEFQTNGVTSECLKLPKKGTTRAWRKIAKISPEQ